MEGGKLKRNLHFLEQTSETREQDPQVYKRLLTLAESSLNQYNLLCRAIMANGVQKTHLVQADLTYPKTIEGLSKLQHELDVLPTLK